MPRPVAAQRSPRRLQRCHRACSRSSRTRWRRSTEVLRSTDQTAGPQANLQALVASLACRCSRSSLQFDACEYAASSPRKRPRPANGRVVDVRRLFGLPSFRLQLTAETDQHLTRAPVPRHRDASRPPGARPVLQVPQKASVEYTRTLIRRSMCGGCLCVRAVCARWHLLGAAGVGAGAHLSN